MIYSNTKKKKIRKILGVVFGVALSALAVFGIAATSYHVSKNIVLANDFADGRNVQLDFNLVDSNGDFVQDIAKEEKMMEQSSNFLIKNLEEKNLTNISVTYGFQYREVEKPAQAIQLTSTNFDGLKISNTIDTQIDTSVNTSKYEKDSITWTEPVAIEVENKETGQKTSYWKSSDVAFNKLTVYGVFDHSNFAKTTWVQYELGSNGFFDFSKKIGYYDEAKQKWIKFSDGSEYDPDQFTPENEPNFTNEKPIQGEINQKPPKPEHNITPHKAGQYIYPEQVDKLKSQIINFLIANNKWFFFNGTGLNTNDYNFGIVDPEFDDKNGSLRFELTLENKTTGNQNSQLAPVLIHNTKINIFGFKNHSVPDLNPAVSLKNNEPTTLLRLGLLTASFENSTSSFSLRDFEDAANQLYNDSQVNKNLSVSNRYSLEPIKSQYVGIDKKTGRLANRSFLFVDDPVINLDRPVPYQDDISYYLINTEGNYTDIKPYVDTEGKKSDTLVSILNDKKYNSGAFVLDRNDYQKIIAEENENSGSGDSGGSTEGETTPPATFAISQPNQNIETYEGEGGSTEENGESTQPSKKDQFQTKATWILWNDKEGLINRLNQLIVAWYFNMYANIPLNANGSPELKKEDLKQDGSNMNEILYNTDKWKYPNYMSVEVRDNINNYLATISTVEKQFMAFMAFNASNVWQPDLITGDELIPLLYDFHEASMVGKTPPSSHDHSESEINGWAWIESDASDNIVKNLLGSYLVSFIDYKNYAEYFKNPNPPDVNADDYKETNPITPFYINDFTFASTHQTGEEFINYLKNDQYQFPLVNLINFDKFKDGWVGFAKSLIEKGSTFESGKPKELDTTTEDVGQPVKDEHGNPVLDKDGRPLYYKYKDKNGNKKIDEYQKDLDEYLKKYNEGCTKIANDFLKPNLIFGFQNASKPKIDQSFLKLPPLTVLFIIISIIIFLVGVFISIRYRIPGFISFMMTSLTYVLSLLIYNLFGFAFSFFSLISVIVGVFLSFFSSFFFFTNFKKEIIEDSSVVGAVVKTIRKYWRMSMDIHVILILSSLAFLFFGEINNVNFGAMLIVSVFLSFILSGVIYYLLFLFFTIWFEMNHERFFLSAREYKALLNFSTRTKKENKFLTVLNKMFININYFAKYNYIIFGLIILVGIIGTVVLSVVGPISSFDFSSSNIFIINNFDSLGLSKEKVIEILNISESSSYVYDNQLVIYSTDIVNTSQIVSNVLTNPDKKAASLLINNVSMSILSSKINIRLVLNTLKCFGIAIGFSSIWSLVSLNFISVLPVAITQGIISLFMIGLIGISRMPFDVNGLVIFTFLFLIATAINVSTISCLKHSWNRKIEIDHENLRLLFINIMRKVNRNYVMILLLILVFAIFSMIFVSPSLIFTFLAMIICVIMLLLISNRLQVNLWYWGNILFNKFSKELVVKEKPIKRFDYDDVNEQMIISLNC